MFWKVGSISCNEVSQSELEDAELPYLRPAVVHVMENEDDLKRDCSTYAEKFKFVKDDIMSNIKKYDAFYGKFDLDDLLDEVLVE